MADIELNHVNSSPHGAYDVARENKPGLDTQTDATATAASSLTKDGAKQYDFLTGFRMYNLVAAMMLSMLLLGLDINIVATAIPTISNYFHSIADISWYGSAFLMAICALQPIAGKLYTYFSLKYTFVAFFVIFELGNLISALAQSSGQIIGGRTVSGIGASGLTNGALVIITAACPPAVRPMASAAGISMIAIGGIFGPLLSGVLIRHAGWRWCFWVFLPPGGVTIIIMLLLHIPEQTDKPPVRSILPVLSVKLDFLGFALFAPACIMFLLALNWAGTSYPWDSATIIGLLCGSAATIGAFAAWSIYRQDNALMPPRMMRRRALFFGCWISGLQGGATIMMGYYLPVWFQSIKGADPQNSGLMMLPTMISQILGAGMSGALVRRLHYVPPWAIFGSLLTVIGSALMTTFTANTSEGKWIGYQILAGFGRGAALNMPIISVQEELSGEEIAVATGAIALSQYLAGSIAISIAQTVFQNKLKPALAQYAPNVAASTILNAGATGFRATLQPDLLAGVLKAYNEALVNVFYIPTATSGLALLLSFGFPWTKIGVGDKKKKEIKQSSDASAPTTVEDTMTRTSLE